MKAMVFDQYGTPDVLHLKEIPTPEPKPNQVLVRIKATAATSGDCRLRRADPFGVRFFFGFFRPKIHVLGDGFSGIVERVGTQVTQFKVGDEVMGAAGTQFGAYAEYLCVDETGAIVPKPATLSHEAAACVPFGGVTAWHFLKEKAQLRAGQSVLIIGGAGAVGSAAVQIAKALGAEVTAVCSQANAETVKALGAQHILDYAATDLSQLSARFDFVYETVNKNPISTCKRLLKPNGTLLMGAAMLPEMLQIAWISLRGRYRAIWSVAFQNRADLSAVTTLAAQGQFSPFIGRVFRFEALAEAHRYVESGSKAGNVSIVM